ncbi:PASTA domain-containing protein [Streptomyces sp. NBC_01485]|uniref:PASTA domain-containing protein n=1 Tax=Streptomyces sp. NBC_01485 TaxID=2903884 RepID=UPI003FCD1750
MGDTQAQARQELSSAGYVLAGVGSVVDCDNVNRVSSQNPAAGTPLVRGGPRCRSRSAGRPRRLGNKAEIPGSVRGVDEVSTRRKQTVDGLRQTGRSPGRSDLSPAKSAFLQE